MIKPRDINYINKLTKYVKDNRIEGMYTVGALLTEKKSVLSWGLNDYNKTNPNTPQILDYIIPTHAEVNCVSKFISKRNYINDNMTLYIVGLTKSEDANYVISSKPCESCLWFIGNAGIKRIVFVENKKGNVEILEAEVKLEERKVWLEEGK